LRTAIVAAYRLRLAPRGAPDLARGRALYAQECAGCHGSDGRGDGPAAKGLEPAPANFHDLPRMAQRSAYALYSTITLGVAGTSMASFPTLSEADRWALAFAVATMGVSAPLIDEGGRLWRAGRAHGALPDLDAVATLSEQEIGARFGPEAVAVHAFLRAHPESVRPSPLAYARQQVGAAAERYAHGDASGARHAALAAYLDGFELVEASLRNVDGGLMRRTEHAMLELRAAIERGEPPAALAQRADQVDRLLAEAADRLGTTGLSAPAAFAASLAILLREGREAILVLAAIIAFVVRTGRRDALPLVHAGWLAALMLGALTWVIARYLVDISGAGRELTEGVTALLAAAMLLYVGYWLHGKSYAQAWSRFIREQVGEALARRTLWAMAAVSFLAVYREMFEVVLFYEALWIQAGSAGGSAVLGGAAVAAVLLAAIGIAVFKYSVRLPIGPFFGTVSALLAMLAVIFTGHGIAALQEAGVLAATGLGFDAVPLLGIFPSVEALGAQLLALAAVALGFVAARRAAVAHAA
jgi:high-affinity iron transporter